MLLYDHQFVIRGLVVDKELGNIFKMDRHNHVGRCYHGLQPLDPEQRRLYRAEKIRLSLPRFAWIDTLFSLPEACLYAEIIDDHLEGEARLAGRELAGRLRNASIRRERPFCLVAGGETAVTLNGNGKGGRNQELALAAVDCTDTLPVAS